MAKIPDQYSLSNAPSLRSGRQVASYDTSGLTRGIESLGSSLEGVADSVIQQQNAVDISRAEAYKTKGLLDTQNQFENDPDYSTLSKRGNPQVDKTVADAANLIRDPKMRERWSAEAQTSAIKAKDWLTDQATQKKRGAETSGLDDANQSNYNLVIDPNTPEDVRAKARADIGGSIDMAVKSGLITPEEASKRRELFVQKSYDEQALLAAKSGNLSLPNTDALVKSMTSVESGGNPNAESNKGALGLMQVTPGTAAGIAKEIGDTNFPTDPEKQKEYLKNPEVSTMYGKRYLGDMLHKYNGDEEAALIAYNGGPGAADKWLASGRDDSVLPTETADYYKKVLGGIAPTGKFDSQQQALAKSYLQAHTDKGPEAIQGMNGDFSVKLSQLFQSAPQEIKDKLGVFSGFRTDEHQAELYKQAVAKYGPGEASKWVAPPGRSNHNKGLAADVSFDGKSLKDAPPEVVDWLHQNAGKYGLSFPLANENWHIEDASARSGPVKSYPSYWDKVSPLARQQATDLAAAETQRQQQQQIADLKAQQQQARDDFNLRLAVSPVGVSQQEILNNPSLDNGDKATLINTRNSALKENAGVNDFLTTYNTGAKMPVNGFNSDETKVADKAYTALMGQTPPENQPLVTRHFIGQTGYVPPAVQADLRKGIVSTDPNVIAQSMLAANAIKGLAPEALNGFAGAEDVQKKMDAFNSFTNLMGYTPQEAGQKLADANDPEKVKAHDALLKSDAMKQTLKNITPSTVKSLYGHFGFRPNLGDGPLAEAAMVSDYKDIYQEALIDSNGDPTVAADLASKRFQRVYAPSQFNMSGDNVVVKYPPERGYPPGADGTWNYVHDQLIQALKTQGINTDTAYLQPDTSTESDIKSGVAPRYQVFYKDADGKLQQYNLPFYADAAAEKKAAADLHQQIVNDSEQKMQENRVKPHGFRTSSQNQNVTPLSTDKFEPDPSQMEQDDPIEAGKTIWNFLTKEGPHRPARGQ